MSALPVNVPNCRDRVLTDLLRLVLRFPEPARAAADRLNSRFKDWIVTKQANKKRDVVEKRALLPIARDMALDEGRKRPLVMKPSSQVIDWKNPPPGFDPYGADKEPCPEWVWRAYLAVGHMNFDIRYIVKHLANDWRAALKRGQSITGESAVEAYARMCVGRWPYEEHLARLDPDQANDASATIYVAIWHQVIDVLREDPALERTNDRHWEVALLSLLVGFSAFVPESVGLVEMPGWDHVDEPSFFHNSRNEVLEWIGGITHHDTTIPEGVEARLCLVAERARDRITLIEGADYKAHAASTTKHTSTARTVDLAEMERNALIACKEVGHHSLESRIGGDALSKKAGYGEVASGTFKTVLAGLVRRRLLGSKSGRDGGYWLTAEGESVLTNGPD